MPDANPLPRLDPDALSSALPTDALVGRKILVFEETDSTNDLAARAGEDGLPEGLVIFAESQRAGRGRLGRKWTATPRQSLLLSLLLRPFPIVPVEHWSELTFCAALAVAETAEAFTGQSALVKWPNDVYLCGRKIAGILLEVHHRRPPGFVVVGIGLNVLQQPDNFHPEVRDHAGSLAMCSAFPLSRLPVAAFLLRSFGAHYARWPDDFPAIMAACTTRGCIEPDASSPI